MQRDGVKLALGGTYAAADALISRLMRVWTLILTLQLWEMMQEFTVVCV